MFKDRKDPAGEVREQILDGAKDFFAHSISALKKRMERDHSTLQSLLEQLPDSEEDILSRSFESLWVHTKTSSTFWTG